MIASKLIELVAGLLRQCDTEKTHFPPTTFFNEGWMVRIMTSVSIEEDLQLKGIDFGKMANWYSEGMLASPYPPAFRGDSLGEGYTHADMALGNFTVDAKNRGEILIKGNTGNFGVIEAKMNSPLSKGTAHAPNYDQASRNLACIAFSTRKTQHEIFFAVAAPQIAIEKHKIDRIVDKSSMLAKISDRFDSYNEPELTGKVSAEEAAKYAAKYAAIFQEKDITIERAAGATCIVISYEEWLSELKPLVGSLYQELRDFYKLCKTFNHVR